MSIDYVTWVQRVFCYDELPDYPTWYETVCDVAPADRVSFMTRLFTHCRAELARFDDAQVARGLRFVGASGESEFPLALYDPAIGWPDRVACLRSIGRLYSDCFAARCADAACHGEIPANSLNGVCFMWWDVWPSGGGTDTTDFERANVDAELIGVMAKVLEIPHDACCESALHGLGHWEPAEPARVRGIIDGWLARNSDLDPRLLAYARAAREGHVQ